MRTRRSALWVSLFSVSLPFFGCGGEPSEKCEAGYFSSLDGMCEALTECTGNQYETAAPTETSDRRCAPLTVCAAEEFEVRPPTATRDRDCAPVTPVAFTFTNSTINPHERVKVCVRRN